MSESYGRSLLRSVLRGAALGIGLGVGVYGLMWISFHLGWLEKMACK